ncbi:MAG: hypothetical protein M3P33_02760 [bacterium]|nr:hypothetical protein [bacterium]
MKPDDFKIQLGIFTSSGNSTEHNKAIIDMLDPQDLDIEYKKLISEGGVDRILEIFISFSDASSDELINEYEQKSLEQVGELSKKHLLNKEYRAFAQMIFELTLESLSEYYSEELLDTVLVLNSKSVYSYITDEIYLQLFLLDTMANDRSFDWGRDQKIIVQSLNVLTICFSDIYSFLIEDDDVDEMAD